MIARSVLSRRHLKWSKTNQNRQNIPTRRDRPTSPRKYHLDQVYVRQGNLRSPFTKWCGNQNPLRFRPESLRTTCCRLSRRRKSLRHCKAIGQTSLRDRKPNPCQWKPPNLPPHASTAVKSIANLPFFVSRYGHGRGCGPYSERQPRPWRRLLRCCCSCKP